MNNDKDAVPLKGIRYLLLWAPFVALVLNVIGISLIVPRGYGIEDYLGWVHQDAVRGMNDVWHGYKLGPLNLVTAAGVYLAVDTVVLIPLYGALFLALADKFLCATARDGRPNQQWPRSVVIGVVLALLLVDLIENLVGMVRLGPPGLMGGVLPTGVSAALFGFVMRGRWDEWWKAWPKFVERLNRRQTTIAVATWLVLGFAVAAWRKSHDQGLNGADAILAAGALAHQVKQWGLIAYAVLLAGLAGAWFFGLFIPNSRLADHEARASLRRAVGDMLWRCRYVWMALVVFAGLALLLNQGRDVLYSVAAMESGPAHKPDWIGGLFVAVMSAVGMWSFGFAAWLWSRSVCLIRSPQSKTYKQHKAYTKCTKYTKVRQRDNKQIEALSYADRFARDLARILGLLPPTLFVLLCSSTLHDAVMAGKGDVAWRLLAFILVAIAGGAVFVFIHIRDKDEKHFYDCDEFCDWYEKAEGLADSTTPRHPRFQLFGRISPFWLPFYAAGGMFLCRLAAVWMDVSPLGPWPPMVLATFFFTLTFWLSVFGWLSLSEQGTATPWVLILLVIVGTLGFTGWMQNHRVGGLVGQMAPASDFWPTVAAGLLMLICLELFWAIVRRASADDTLTFWDGAGRVVAALMSALLVLWRSDSWVPKPAEGKAPPPVATISLDDALAAWVKHLYDQGDALLAHAGSARLPVYFVNAEGGGIRNAYWTTLVLDRLAADVPDFRTRTFSYSGVSGGSVGLAVDRVCANKQEPADKQRCLDSFAHADLITPLISTWLFEDVLAQILPTSLGSSFCKTPACGVLSRGVRFEDAILRAVPGIEAGIVASRAGSTHQPYLFLNSTWVESGERAIASEISIDWHDFPAARDQLALRQPGMDLSLATAAHNSARFPFINAIGALQVPKGACVAGLQQPLPSGAAKETMICGHLADGGYFDNSGGHTTADILNGLARYLSTPPKTAGNESSQEFRAWDWARRTLAPQIIQIRNGIHPDADERPNCDKSKPPSTADEVKTTRHNRASDLYQPGRPGCDGEMKLYGEVLGPIVTAINTTGIGANGKLSEADLQHRITSLFRLSEDGKPPVANIDLIEDGRFLYPLGWHLSPIAREGMQQQAGDKRLLDRVSGVPIGQARLETGHAPTPPVIR
ncbi:MAG: hypothetical protein L6Q69_11440 [Zoogloea sp.]|nr:hypothetical protein [Zoogloea sp.]